MDFTREPIIQTVITPKDGCKIVVRSSKNSGQEEYFVDAVEVVSFGTAIFFRSLERPKSFLVPATDYEVLEVREARMVLKNVGIDRAIKIGGGRDAAVRGGREQVQEKQEISVAGDAETSEAGKTDAKTEQRLDKKRDRRRNARRRRGRDDSAPKDEEEEEEGAERADKVVLPKPSVAHGENGDLQPLTSVLSSLLPPPSTLISETIARYRDNASFRGAFFNKEEQEGAEKADGKEENEPSGEEEQSEEALHAPTVPLPQPEFGSFEMSEDEEEAIYQERHILHPEEQEESAPVAETEPSHQADAEHETESKQD